GAAHRADRRPPRHPRRRRRLDLHERRRGPRGQPHRRRGRRFQDRDELPRQRPLHRRRRRDGDGAGMPGRLGQVRARPQDVRPGDRPLPAGAADDRAHVAGLRDLPPRLLQGRLDEEHGQAAHAPGLDGQAVRDGRGLQRRPRRGRGARGIRLLRRVPGRAFPPQRARADHLRRHARGAHDPPGRVRARLPRGPAGQEIAASVPARLDQAAGTAGDLLFLTGIALAGSYWWIVLFYFLLQFASNTAQAPYQGLLPDVVPETQRGEASGYYGVANLVGIAGGTVAAGLLLAHFGR